MMQLIYIVNVNIVNAYCAKDKRQETNIVLSATDKCIANHSQCKFIVCRQQFFMMRGVHAIFANIDIADIRGRVGHGDYCVNNISTTATDVNR